MKNMKRVILVVLYIFTVQFSSGQNDRNLIRSGNKEYKRKNFSDAEMDYRKSIEKNPKSYEGNYNLGNALYKQGKQEEAVKYFSGSAELNKDKAAKERSYYNLGNALLKSDKFQESVDAYKQSLKVNPNDEDARYNLAYALSKLRQKQEQQKKNQNQKKDQKDQKNQDKQDQQKQQEQKNKEQQAKNQQQQKSQPKISKEDAERMLQALKNEEKNLQKKLAKRYDATMGNPEKDW